ncbi:cytochrome P450 [Jidongwangia harbinensis]|uniref:cytochrome P450 n=1 Tax=Jidongwangia harbinensis TaxID=2878561 RepID=UPI001CD96B9B|nr:cytochrome P450 [Jidongwangia harbinensis]MCA2217391.1 cytochrome P450 [Jidongwangia harbinensis]
MRSLSLLNVLRPEVQADLYGYYDRLRDAGPCRWDRPLSAWVVTGHELVGQAARDPRLSSVRYPDLAAVEPELRPVAAVLSRQMLYVDPPDHPRLRGLVSKAFTARAIEALRAQITRTVDGILDRVLPHGGMEVVGDLAHPLPVTVICDLLGVPEADREQMRAWSADVAVVVGNPRLSDGERDAAVRSMAEMIAYFGTLSGRRTTGPEPDVLDALLRAQHDGAGLTVDEALANTVLLFMAGQETTTHFLGNAMRALLEHPDQAARLRAEPELWTTAVEELLRFDSPVQLMLRRAKQDVRLGDAEIQAGQAVLVVCGAANHDPGVFDTPRTLDLGRTGPRHVAFGHGPHFCLGAGLARLEGEVALRAMLTRLPGLRLSDAAPRWQRSLDFRGLTELRVRWDVVPG